jgi:Outer membrane protein beta-barrel domain
MKNILMITALFLMSVQAWSQENMVTISGGYSTANIEDTDVKGTGWRINGNYEFNPSGGIFANGVSFGYIHISASEDVLQQTVTNTIHSFPLYYAPKVMFGSDKAKLFLKGAIGMQFASLKREGAVTFSDNDAGFYGGGGAGGMLFLTESVFLNVEYEIAYAKNNFYGDGWLNSIMGGVGIKF